MIEGLVRAPRLGAEPEAWAADVRRFLAAEMSPESIAGEIDPTELTGLTTRFERAHHRRAGERGLLGISLPVEFGGGGKPPSWKALYDFEAAYHDAPSIDTGVTLCGHALAHHGSAQQQAGQLTAMMRGAMTACIAYTEPDAGSDLAALRSTARRTPTGWRLNGRKVLVTGGHRADVCLTLARTAPDGPAKSSMTMFLLAMNTPGVSVTRHPTINGWTLESIDFESVELGDECVVGTVGAGWGQVLGALGAERAGLAYLGWATRRVEELFHAHAASADHRLLGLAIGHGRARRFSERVLARLDAGEPLGHSAPVAKLVATELLADIARLGAEFTGEAAAAPATLFGTGHRFAYELLERLHPTIGAGASEIQRDTIARFLPQLVDRNSAADAADAADAGQIAAAGELAEHARALLQLTWERVSTREQFGRPLAEFQVVRHRLVDALIDVESIEAAIAECATTPAESSHAVAAKLLANDAALRVSGAAHQLCGGHGYLEDAGLGVHTRRIHELIAGSGASRDLRRTLWTKLIAVRPD